MQGFNKKRITLLIFLVSFSSAILGLGIDIIVQGNIAYNKDIQSQKLKSITILDARHAYVSDSQIYGISAYYQTNDVFCVGNPLNATLVLLVKNPDQFDKIMAIGTDAEQNNVLNTALIQESLQNGISYPDNITLNRNPSDDSFIGTLHNYSMKSEEQLGFLFIPYTNGTMRGSFLYQDQPLKIYPSTAELQAQTDRDIQRQNIETSRTNSHVEGLTFIIIGLVPIGIFMDLIIHRFLVNY